jgi:WD40 repeat protein
MIRGGSLAGVLVAVIACSKTVGDDSLLYQFSTGDRAHIAAIRFLPDGSRVATATGDGAIRIFELQSGREVGVMPSSTAIDSLAVGPGARAILAGNEDGTLSLWDVAGPTLAARWNAHDGPVHGLDIAPDGRTAASGSDDGTVKIWALPSGAEVRTLRGHEGWVGRVAFSPDGTRVLSASADTTLRIWNVESGATEQVLRGNGAWVRSGVFVAGGERVLSGGYDQVLRLYDARTGDIVRAMRSTRGMVYEVDASPDGRWGISVNSNASVSLWNLATGDEAHVYATPWRGGRNSTSCGAISPDGTWVAAGDWDAVVHVWDLRSAETGVTR